MGSDQSTDRAQATTDRTTALVLAAGQNARLEGVVPPFMKPLLLVNGRTLFQQAIDHAQVWDAQRVVAVVSPDNARPLVSLGWSQVEHWVMQPRPVGVVNALRLGVRAITTPWTLVLCADNTFDFPDESSLGRLQYGLTHGQAMFGSRVLPGEETRRFTRWRNHMNNVRFAEGLDESAITDGCWIGPLLVPTHQLRHALDVSRSIVDVLNKIVDAGVILYPLPMLCADLGVPEAL